MERGVALVLVADVTGEGQPSVADLDVDEVVGDLGVPVEDLKRDPADVGTRATLVVEDPDLQLVVDLVDSVCVAGVADGRPALAEAADRPSQHNHTVDGRDGDSSGEGTRGSPSRARLIWS